MHSWLKGSSSLHHLQADLCSRNRVTTAKKLLMYHGDCGGRGDTLFTLFCFNVVHRSKLWSCWSMHERHTCTHRFKIPCVCSQSTAAALSPGKEPHSAGSYDSAFGFSARPPAHLWGPRGSLASSASLISTCQPASCCVWIQGMSGATSRSHSRWQDESEGQGLAYGSD